LGGTSLLGGRGFPAASALAALFLKQLDMFVLSLGVPYGVRTIVISVSLMLGIALYAVNWKSSNFSFKKPDKELQLV
jgi:ribose transport system permease protein